MCEFFIIQNEEIFRVVPKRSFDTKMAGNSSPYTSWIEDWCITDWQGQIRTTCHFFVGGKSMSTLRKRSDQPAWFMAWGLDHSRGSLFPLTLADSRDYFSYMSRKQRARSRYTGWLECAGFLHHILGVFIEDGYHNDPYVKGLIRQQLMDRPQRKQSRTFRVKEIIDLENFLEELQH